MVKEESLREKILAFKSFEARLQGLLQQRDLLAKSINEMQSTLETVDELQKNPKEEIIFSIGSAAYMPGKTIENKKLIVEVGAGVALEKSTEEAKKIIEARKKEFEKTLSEIQIEALNIGQLLDQLAPIIQKLSEKG